MHSVARAIVLTVSVVGGVALADPTASDRITVLPDGSVVITPVKLDLSAPTGPALWRNGVPHDFAKHNSLFQPADGGKTPVSLGWKEPVLHVEAGGHVFHGELAESGVYKFTNTLAK